ncbi:TIGR03564 family F420-dependent LLM class oxidoreductase [Saccharopolyspora taberi]|uniref:TIGR03564 family F420-dependent LLM class oxidoreductase n=1 Tax=Saccharopolyspora taberi TaxID=60895 RepID=A0ABN3VKP9_9PSEU
MRIGLALDERGRSHESLVDEAGKAAAAGFPAFWLGQHTSWDVLTTLAVAGSAVPGIRLGTAIVPTYPRHPLALAGQALTVQAVTGNRLDLGVGLSHQVVIEGQFGLSFDKPARHLREYLSALGPLLRGESVDFQGETLKAVGEVEVPGARSPSLLVAALGPAMLRVAGELADGTVTMWAGPRTLDTHIVPAITRASAGTPRVVVMVMVCVTGDPSGARDLLGSRLAVAGELPSYRAVLDREGAGGPAEVAVVGDEAAVRRELGRYADAGATEFVAVPFGTAEEQRRTTALLAGINRESCPGSRERP